MLVSGSTLRKVSTVVSVSKLVTVSTPVTVRVTKMGAAVVVVGAAVWLQPVLCALVYVGSADMLVLALTTTTELLTRLAVAELLALTLLLALLRMVLEAVYESTGLVVALE